MNTAFYPASPTGLPPDLTALSRSYKIKVTLAIASIVVFFLLYFSMIAALGWLVYYSFVYDPVYLNKLTIILKLGAIAGSIMLFIFTLKFIFKLKNHKPENRIKLNMSEHPRLAAFIDQICKETGAPKPKSVYADPDVNAYVAYTNVWQSLILPTKKDLTIGLGLVSCVNLSEFKAITAHEFGHFAQRSMKVGSYILSANTIIHDMIFNRDKWDQTLANWRASDIRLSFAAWIITPVIWIIRQILNLFYQFLNIMYSSLSREMEFNADKVAVSVTGSEPIVSGLWKLDTGVTAWNETLNHAYTAGRKNQFVKNLYTHHIRAIEKATPAQTKLLTEMPADQRGGKLYFTESENSKVGMYASHPPNDQRENSAKKPFVATIEDVRSPWILFDLPTLVQEKMTEVIYEKYLQRKPENCISDEAFEQYIAAESKGKELFAEYDNTFENRFLTIPELNTLQNVSPTLYNPELLKKLKAAIIEKMQPVRELEALMLKVQNIAQGTSTEKTFNFNGKSYGKRNLNEGYDALMKEREKLFRENFSDWDKQFCELHFSLAKKTGRDTELQNLYGQHQQITVFYQHLAGFRNAVLQRLAGLQNRNDIQPSELTDFSNFLDQHLLELNKMLVAFDQFHFVALPNISSTHELKEAIIEGGQFKREYGKIFENGGFDRIGQQIESAVAHCQRLDQKSVAAILEMHGEMEKEVTTP